MDIADRADSGGRVLWRSRARSRSWSPDLPFHFRLCRKAFELTENGDDRQSSAVALVADRAILLFDVAVDVHGVPFFRVADVVDRDVVVLAPKEGDGVEALTRAQHVLRSGLALTLRDYPMLDADRLADAGIGPAGRIARGKSSGRAGLQMFVDQDSAVHP